MGQKTTFFIPLLVIASIFSIPLVLFFGPLVGPYLLGPAVVVGVILCLAGSLTLLFRRNPSYRTAGVLAALPVILPIFTGAISRSPALDGKVTDLDGKVLSNVLVERLVLTRRYDPFVSLMMESGGSPTRVYSVVMEQGPLATSDELGRFHFPSRWQFGYPGFKLPEPERYPFIRAIVANGERYEIYPKNKAHPEIAIVSPIKDTLAGPQELLVRFSKRFSTQVADKKKQQPGGDAGPLQGSPLKMRTNN